MSNDFQQNNQFNPYQSNPATFESNQQPVFNKVKVQAPAIALAACGVLSLLASIYGVVNALISPPPPVPANSPEFVAEMMKNSVGPMAAGIQSVFIVVALFVLFGAIQMLRIKTRGIAIAASVVSMINVGSCCCILGMPIGIWALVILLMGDVKQAFESSRSY
jgi:hypothetical protein